MKMKILQKTKNLGRAILLFVVACCITPALAQPSGGPYGPVAQTYELPKTTGTIYFVAPEGNPESDGTHLTAPTTIETAFKKVRTGDAIVLRGGTYRTGNLLLNQGITMQPFGDEQPVLKGTYEAKDWKKLNDQLWVTKWDRLFPMEPADWWVRHRSGPSTPLHRFQNDMVFADGRFLQSTGWEGDVDKNSYYIDYENGEVYIGNDPEEHTIEITAFNLAIHRVDGELNGVASDQKGPTIRGITFTQYAYRAFEFDGTNPEEVSPEANHGKRVTGTTLEHVTISFCSRVGGYFRGDNFTMRNCQVSDTSTEGVFILSSSDVLLERNIFARNNIEDITGYFPAAVKIFNQCYRVVCNDNLVTDLEKSNGIWYDVGNVDGVFTNNRMQNIGTPDSRFNPSSPWAGDIAFFFEISKGVTVAGNEFIDCDQGVFILNSSDTKIYQNTFVNSAATFARTPRSAEGDHFGWHPASGPDVDERHSHVFVNNLMVANKVPRRPFVNVWQTPELCEKLTESPLKEMNGNVYVKNTSSKLPMLFWSPVADAENCHVGYDGLADFQKALSFESKGLEYTNGSIPLFKGEYTGNYDLLPGFPGHKAASKLPPNVSKILKLSSKQKPYVGAHPAK
jgi:parallel beta-helix repeat protein